jgi:aspartate dehydrogenase
MLLLIYTGSKPPNAWRGTPAEAKLDLNSIASAQTFFQGSAREAARDYPRNANVTATVALAGFGFDASTVRLVAEPGVTMNIHEVRYEGAFGHAQVVVAGHPSPANSRTSLLTGLSIWKNLLAWAAHDIVLD